MQTIVGVIVALVLGFAGGYFYQGTGPDRGPYMMDKGHDAHTHAELDASGFARTPGVDLVVHEDPKGGYNAQVLLSNYRFAPERVSTDHIEGEGHAHIYVDGRKISRVYGEWYHLGDLPPGEREILVNLSTNDHQELVLDGAHIEDVEIIDVPDRRKDKEGDAMEHMEHDEDDHMHDEDGEHMDGSMEHEG